MSLPTGSDNRSHWLASATPQIWPLSPDPAQRPLSDGNAQPPPPQTPSNDPQGSFGQSPAGSHVAPDSVFPVQHPSYQLSQEQIAHFLTLGSPAAFMTLYQHGILLVSPVDGFHAFLCPHCNVFVKSSISVSLALSTSGHFTVLTNHYRRKSCTTQHARNQRTFTQELLKQFNSVPDSPVSSSSNSTLSSSSEESLVSSPNACTPDTTLNFPSEPDLTVGVLPSLAPCYGLPFTWDLAPDSNIQVNLPWLRTLRGKPDELPYTINVLDGQAYARSQDCVRYIQDTGDSCTPCSSLAPALDELGKTIPLYQPRTRRSLKNMLQLSQSVDERSKELEHWKLKSLNDARSIANKLNTINNHSALLMAISQTDVPWLQRILQVQLKNGAGINTIIHHIEDAIERGYKPRGFGDDAYDLALLIYRIGGANLLYAMNQRMSIPSLRSLRNRLSFITITPTIGPIVLDAIVANILKVIIEPRSRTGPRVLRGVSILSDEIALEEAAVYFPSENGVGGLCWKHSHNVDPILNTYESAVQIASQIESGHVHIGKEMTVIVVHLFGEDETYPIVAAPTCKEENYSDWEKLMEKVVDSWQSSGAERTVGPLWSFATDGDATRRKAGHRTLVRSKLDESSPLFGILADIPGLNLYTGKDDITLDFDYKHIFKRFCTMLRSAHGMVLGNGRRMNAKTLEHYMAWLDNCGKEKAKRLMYPDDPQDVPRAIELMRAVIQLGRIDTTMPPYTPFGQVPDVIAYLDFETIRMLGDLFHNLLEPFINPGLSLTQQVIHLSTFAHLLFSFYRSHRRSFMPNQLYYDSQTLVKNVMFCIAKQQRLNPSEPFFLPDVGDDPIELLFAFLRMCGGHNSALNYKQAIDRLRAARDIGGVYSRNPDLRHGHQRLNLSRTEHLDHMRRDMWTGDILSRNVNLRACWLSGRDAAIAILSKTPTYTEDFEYDKLFSTPGVDMLCVFGNGLYPGITEAEEEDDPSLQVPSGSSRVNHDGNLTDLNAVQSAQGEAGGPDEEVDPILNLEEQLERLTIGNINSNDAASINPHVSTSDSLPSIPSGPGVRADDFLLVEGKYIHKSSFCRIFFNSTFNAKSLDRLRRVRGFTSVNKQFSADLGLPSPDDTELSFVTGSPFLSLVRFNDQTVALALFRSSSISENGVSRAAINVKTLLSPVAKVKVNGDVLLLRPSMDPDTTENSWAWTGAFLTSLSPVPNANITTRKVVDLSVHGALIEPVNPSIVTASQHLPIEHCTEINSRDITWLLTEDVLEASITTIWKRLCDLKVPISNIAVLSSSHDGFPYSKNNGIPALLCLEATQALSEENVTISEVLCALCHKPTNDLRSHMGGHILRSIRGVPEELATPVGQILPCGFCGASGNMDCAVKLKKKKRTAPEIITNCPHKVPFKYGFAEKGSDSRPCRNVPVICSLCPRPSTEKETEPKPAIWRYNMEQHLSTAHPEYANPGKALGLALPAELLRTVLITPLEEKKFGVPPRPIHGGSANTSNHGSTHSPATATSGQKRKADAEHFRLVIGSSNGSKRARIVKH